MQYRVQYMVLRRLSRGVGYSCSGESCHHLSQATSMRRQQPVPPVLLGWYCLAWQCATRPTTHNGLRAATRASFLLANASPETSGRAFYNPSRVLEIPWGGNRLRFLRARSTGFGSRSGEVRKGKRVSSHCSTDHSRSPRPGPLTSPANHIVGSCKPGSKSLIRGLVSLTLCRGSSRATSLVPKPTDASDERRDANGRRVVRAHSAGKARRWKACPGYRPSQDQVGVPAGLRGAPVSRWWFAVL